MFMDGWTKDECVQRPIVVIIPESMGVVGWQQKSKITQCSVLADSRVIQDQHHSLHLTSMTPSNACSSTTRPQVASRHACPLYPRTRRRPTLKTPHWLPGWLVVVEIDSVGARWVAPLNRIPESLRCSTPTTSIICCFLIISHPIHTP